MRPRPDERSMGVIGGTAAAIGLAGLVLGAMNGGATTSFGWFAYQPLAGQAFRPGPPGLFVSWWTLAGALVLGVGLLVIAYEAGRRSAARTHRTGKQEP